jgi:hypothetical protein
MGETPFLTWAAENKKRYLEEVQLGNGNTWTVVMGNEAGGMQAIHGNIQTFMD